MCVVVCERVLVISPYTTERVITLLLLLPVQIIVTRLLVCFLGIVWTDVHIGSNRGHVYGLGKSEVTMNLV